ncbi:hypothetical protein AMJ52_08810 [candidate division TA06 bacterium DG_78]|uniref:Right handed beta helix domain-containing protein n=1 Tax=candidate division TA06 bacterium DG_78 TaxID=1703772 RepID=A0A0S7YA21_UNCT6|nr:MAG: hypothetical protein AMJ52_08810 [candidate division TA06 bacterium DG_78]
MDKSSKFIGGIGTLLLLFCVAQATTWYVHPDSTLNSIQAGIDSCSTGDTVLVGPGTYIENINFKDMAITVKSEHGADTTIIDGSSPAHPDSGSVVLFKNGENTSSVLDGFTITSGSGTVSPWGHMGGGIYCTNASSPTIINNIVIGNTATYAGGVECEEGSNAIISYNTITDNTITDAGGGVEIYNASPTVTHNTIDGNTALYGGGISTGSSSPTISHNIITDNIAPGFSNDGGGGIWMGENCTASIHHNLITNNSNHGIVCGWPTNPTIYYNDIIDNVGCGVLNAEPSVTTNAENNWWGDATGPYHPTANPGGLGDTVSDYVDFDPWLASPGIKEYEIISNITAVLEISPNPFRQKTDIRFQILDVSDFELRIYDISGRAVKIFDQPKSPIIWRGIDENGNKLPSGVYFVKLEVAHYTTTKKLLLIR